MNLNNVIKILQNHKTNKHIICPRYAQTVIPDDLDLDSVYLGRLSSEILSSVLIDKYWGRWNIALLSSNSCLTPETIDKYWGEWESEALSFNSGLTPETIEKYWGEWDIEVLSENEALTPEIIERHIDELEMKYLSSNSSLNSRLIEKYWNILDIDQLSCNHSLSEKLLEKYIELLYSLPSNDEPFDRVDGYMEYYNPIENCKSIQPERVKENMSNLSSNPCLTENIIVKYWGKWNMNKLRKQLPRLIQIQIDNNRNKFDRVMNQLSFCPYYKDFDPSEKYQHHYHQGYNYILSEEDSDLIEN